MLTKNLIGLASLCLVVAAILPAVASAEVYELRTYTTNPGRLDALNARFRDHTTDLFEKHGMKNIGYWVPTDEPQSANTLIYVIAHESREAAAASWRAFIQDPEWTKVAQESEKDGRILAEMPGSVFMEAADYSPDFKSSGDGDTVYELRIYKTNEGKLPNLDARFRDHTIRLFEEHGMKSVAYWHPTDEPDSADTLIYILEHESRDAAKASWPAFGSDPAWQEVAKESQVDGQILAERPTATYLEATDYSPIR